MVLHKQLAVRLIALLLVAGIGAAGIANRTHIANYVQDFSGRVSALFAQAGLSVAELSCRVMRSLTKNCCLVQWG